MPKTLVRRSSDRGATREGWLDSKHTFSFADYEDEAWMRFGSLRVINEDRIAPGQGFGEHPHRDMEIVTYVYSGALAHQDSTGTRETLKAGEVQRMTAGSGVWHSEVNASAADECRLLQIWIMPEARGLPPSYEQKPFPDGGLTLVVSPDGEAGSLKIHQDIRVWRGRLKQGERPAMPAGQGRMVWIQLISGRLAAAGETLEKGDGIGITPPSPDSRLEALADAEFLLFDMKA